MWHTLAHTRIFVRARQDTIDAHNSKKEVDNDIERRLTHDAKVRHPRTRTHAHAHTHTRARDQDVGVGDLSEDRFLLNIAKTPHGRC